jgi:copper oxidase (laccase) domain-containing protein
MVKILPVLQFKVDSKEAATKNEMDSTDFALEKMIKEAASEIQQMAAKQCATHGCDNWAVSGKDYCTERECSAFGSLRTLKTCNRWWGGMIYLTNSQS